MAYTRLTSTNETATLPLQFLICGRENAETTGQLRPEPFRLCELRVLAEVEDDLDVTFTFSHT